MATRESDREDLFAEATALLPRAEVRSQRTDSIVLGTRKDEGVSVYFDGDPAYHFDRHNRLKRAFVAGDLFRADDDGITRLTRVRSAEAVQLRSTLMGERQASEFISEMIHRLDELAETERVLRALPDDGCVLALLDRITRIAALLRERS